MAVDRIANRQDPHELLALFEVKLAALIGQRHSTRCIHALRSLRRPMRIGDGNSGQRFGTAAHNAGHLWRPTLRVRKYTTMDHDDRNAHEGTVTNRVHNAAVERPRDHASSAPRVHNEMTHMRRARDAA